MEGGRRGDAALVGSARGEAAQGEVHAPSGRGSASTLASGGCGVPVRDGGGLSFIM